MPNGRSSWPTSPRVWALGRAALPRPSEGRSSLSSASSMTPRRAAGTSACAASSASRSWASRSSSAPLGGSR
eukprot:11436068-Alexandrium_andersonii.AAC.1